MNEETIRKLARYLDCECGPQRWPFRHPGARTRQDRIQRCLAEPSFGWQFVRAIHDLGIKMPNDIEADAVRSAYYWLHFGVDFEHIERAHALSLPSSARLGAILNALLLCRDTEMEAIAKHVNQPVEVIRTYGELFFNVRDRLDDRPYLAGIMFPETRLAELRESAPLPDIAQQLLRAADSAGADEVLFLSGMSDARGSGRRAAETFQQGMMERADLALRYQRLDTDRVIRQATTLSARRNDSDTPLLQDPLISLGLGGHILEEIKKTAAAGASEKTPASEKMEAEKNQAVANSPASQPAGSTTH